MEYVAQDYTDDRSNRYIHSLSLKQAKDAGYRHCLR